MQIINLRYQFVDGHSEEIEVMEDVVATFEEFKNTKSKLNKMKSSDI